METNERNDRRETKDSSTGYLVVRVTTANGAIPLEDALVSIRGEAQQDSGVIYSLKTDRDGKTPKVSLPTPKRSLSDTQGGERPYALYNVDVMKKGYIPAYYHSVPVFPDVLSIQPAMMAPLPESSPETFRPKRQDYVIEETVAEGGESL